MAKNTRLGSDPLKNLGKSRGDKAPAKAGEAKKTSPKKAPAQKPSAKKAPAKKTAAKAAPGAAAKGSPVRAAKAKAAEARTAPPAAGTPAPAPALQEVRSPHPKPWDPFELVAASQTAICVTDLDGRFLYANPAFMELMRVDADKLPLLSWEPDLACTAGEPAPVPGPDAPAVYACEMRLGDGSVAEVAVSRHLARFKNGNPRFYFAYLSLPMTGEERTRAVADEVAEAGAPAAEEPAFEEMVVEEVVIEEVVVVETEIEAVVEAEFELLELPDEDRAPAIEDEAALSPELAALADDILALGPQTFARSRCQEALHASRDSFRKNLAYAAGLFVPEEYGSQELSQAVGRLLALQFVERGLPLDTLGLRAEIEGEPVNRYTALFAAFLLSDLAYNTPDKAFAPGKSATVVLKADKSRISISGDGFPGKKLSLGDPKKSTLAVLALQIASRGGHVLLMGDKATELEVVLPPHL